ncbi:hypothetical protein [Streptomyces sp. CA-132043]|uniref:hypothetical protein n=1 Tax=Streptomyces sp. CA-132043 TaxID=3240048 RepID=UPI003D8BC6BD
MATTLSALAMTGVVALTLPSSAYAATGKLTVQNLLTGKQTPYENPSDCYTLGVTQALSRVNNATDMPVWIYEGPDCQGLSVLTLGPGESNVTAGLSFAIP